MDVAQAGRPPRRRDTPQPDEVQATRSSISLLTADGVREVGVAGVDDDVARLHQVGERVDHGVGRLARLDHDDGGARLGEAVHELLEGSCREELAFGAVLVHELFGTAVGAVEHGHLVAVVSEVACEATAHGGQTDDADVCFSRHAGPFHQEKRSTLSTVPQCSPERTPEATARLRDDGPSTGRMVSVRFRRRDRAYESHGFGWGQRRHVGLRHGKRESAAVSPASG